jgi:hypothetical protein
VIIDFQRGGSVEDDREKMELDRDEGEEVEGHRYEPIEGEKHASDEGEDVEGHKV